MSATATTLSIRGVSVRCWRAGSGQPILYLHDTFSASADAIWLDLHDQLAAHADIIAPIHPGCDGSDEAPDLDTMQDLVFHYLDLCDHLHLDRPILLGASLGGWIAAEIAVRHADRLGGLILINALGLRVPEAPTADILRLDATQARHTLFANPNTTLAQQLLPDLPTATDLPALFQAQRTLARFAWQFPDNPKLTHYLSRITCPTLILWGEQDQLTPSPHGQAYHQGITGSALHPVPDCGHLPHVEHPEACAQAILAFFDALSH